jgi:DNA-binding HxlR family transcriptional regulator
MDEEKARAGTVRAAVNTRPDPHDTSTTELMTTEPKPAGSRSDATTLERTLQLVGDRWSILIIRAALRGIRRFDDFATDLGIARPILTKRLNRLVEGGVMEKELYQEHPPRYEYRLTHAGVSLSPALVALIRWGEHHLAEGGAEIVLVHAPCGTELEQGFWCSQCETTFGPAAIRARTGA